LELFKGEIQRRLLAITTTSLLVTISLRFNRRPEVGDILNDAPLQFMPRLADRSQYHQAEQVKFPTHDCV
jgi:hypothetical protein